MEKLFIEASGFTARVASFLTEDDYSELQTMLMDDPDRGKVMPGCGGFRKIRVRDVRRQKGKRGGMRVVYLHVPDANVILLTDIYDKDIRDDIDPNQKKALRLMANEFKKEAKRKYG